MNATLDRPEESVDRRRRFVADASHELRNPIAALSAGAGPGGRFTLRLPADSAV
ncbi:histidine kinase dimerization/phospho-acceptor domain-containing protein [Streptomyces subrutilus]|nr:hypothetical protein OG479_31050 [Streptomyces subrutilus]GGZ48188.1 hypothetical protein GCM10010371_04520 [Streptomyces subrutilus]